MDGLLQISSVTKRFGPLLVLDRLALSVRRGEFVSLLGPSGCGKTTLLRLIAGLLRTDGGTIRLDGRDLTRLPPHKRNVGVVFQSYALFPHLSVANNVAFGLKARRMPQDEIEHVVNHALSMVQLSDFASRAISALSGGQQQRVAVARALAVKPHLLLLDEPFSALDRNLRESMRIDLRRILRDLGITAVFVTHDQEEALVMSDRVAVMNRGVIEQFGLSKSIYDRPANPFVLEFVGLSTRLQGQIVRSEGGSVEVETAVGRLRGNSELSPGTDVLLAVRPERFTAGGEGGSDRNLGRFRLAEVTYIGSKFQLQFQARSGDNILAEIGSGLAEIPCAGDEMIFTWPVADTLIFATPERQA